jgi:hypothetical protein
MAMDEPTAPEGFSDPSQDYDGEEDELQLSSGETFQGLVLSIKSGDGKHGKWYHLRMKDTKTGRGIVRYFAKDQVKTHLHNDDLEEGDEVWIARATEQDEINGNTYLPTKCRVRD